MEYNEALSYIYGRELFGMKLGLNNIEALLENLGNPHKKFKSVHVAGTKGKGSVCAFISSVMQKAGYKVGLYTSPHLVDFRERITISGSRIGKKSVASILERIIPFVKEHTYFEIVTAMAFLYFAEQKVDIAVVEVGLGGRLDATNVITPEVSVITNISLDHTQHLGNTVEQIAHEKAGIIKPGVPVVLSEKGPWQKVMEKVCAENGSALFYAKQRCIKTSLNGNFQKLNSSAAMEAVEILRKKGWKISDDAVSAGFISAGWPGRLDFVKENVIFDCCHNPSSAKVLSKEMKAMGWENITLVLGIMKDKDIKGICEALEPIASEIIITQPKIPRAAAPEEIAKFITGSNAKVTIIPDVCEALEYAIASAGQNGKVLLTGSIFCVGEAFRKVRPDPFSRKKAMCSKIISSAT